MSGCGGSLKNGETDLQQNLSENTDSKMTCVSLACLHSVV